MNEDEISKKAEKIEAKVYKALEALAKVEEVDDFNVDMDDYYAGENAFAIYVTLKDEE